MDINNLDDRCVSHWLRGALETLSLRDPLDALHDAKLLVFHFETIQKRMKEDFEIEIRK
jgi:hypothetical protein